MRRPKRTTTESADIHRPETGLKRGRGEAVFIYMATPCQRQACARHPLATRRVDRAALLKGRNILMVYRITLMEHANGEHRTLDVVNVRNRNTASGIAYKAFYEMAGYGAARDTRRAWDAKALIEAWQPSPNGSVNDLSVLLGGYSLTLESVH